MTNFYQEFEENINKISHSINNSSLQNHLNYVYIVSCMERYFSSAMLETMEEHPECYENLAQKINTTAKLSTIFQKSLGDFIKENILKNFQYHNINPVKIYYKNAFDIQFPQNLKPISEAIGKRHDIVHRCGYSKSNKAVTVGYNNVEELKNNMIELIRNIDNQLEEKYY